MSGQLAIAAVLVLLALLLAVAALALRRTLITRRGGVVECALRRADGSWRHGLAEYEPAQLSWHWWLSLRLRPSAAFDRAGLRIVRTRLPTSAEAARLGPDLIIAECRISKSDGGVPAGPGSLQALELALSEAALTGLLSWLESSPEYYLRTR